MNMTLADVLLVATLLVVAAILPFLLPGWVLSEGTTLEIESGEKIVGRYGLDEDRTISVQGPLGGTVVKIERGRARIVSSPCPHKICQRMGEIGKSGGVIACVPNEVVIRIGEGRTDGLDAVSR
jgi:hypothetical protein